MHSDQKSNIVYYEFNIKKNVKFKTLKDRI